MKNKKVLDFGCGSGYGTHMLSENADSITGVDISSEAIDYAKKEFSSSNLRFKTISELKNEKFDVITSFQVIEHVPDDREYTANLKKMLNPGGVLIISTPDKKHRLFKYIQQPWNIFHLKEYNLESLQNMLLKHFKDVEVLKIGSESDLVLEEIKRTKKQRIIVLPSTLFFYPYSVRVSLLKLQKNIFDFIKKPKSGNPKNAVQSTAKNDFLSEYSYKDIIFKKEMQYSTDLLAICKNEE
ncbi:methyltransferase domain-containing protein [Chryseobacterium sp. YIM B02567]|uniref:Methyltransferase domain-containing protein n=1 Tax=Chryseobacterium paridis TaxID=2800328 RepID=A0ABS1FTV8_9FLAO|nr:methyltransferase domain-containing protein [Chryseobacterium paridis]